MNRLKRWLLKSREVREKARALIRRRLTRRLESIPGAQPADIAAMRAAHIEDWKELETRFDKGTLAGLSEASTLPGKRLAELLNGETRLSGGRLGSRARRHVFDFVVAAIGAALILLLVESPRQPRVVAARDIPVYTTIAAADLKVDREPDAKKRAGLLARFIGKVTTAGIDEGSPIAETRITKAPFQLTGRAVMEIRVTSVPALDGRALPQAVDVMFSPRGDPDSGAVIAAALVTVDTKTTPPVASLAVNVSDVPLVSRWIGSSDVHLMLRLP